MKFENAVAKIFFHEIILKFESVVTKAFFKFKSAETKTKKETVKKRRDKTIFYLEV